MVGSAYFFSHQLHILHYRAGTWTSFLEMKPAINRYFFRGVVCAL